jgi:NDP-sugar pyrophosphorylase family protein
MGGLFRRPSLVKALILAAGEGQRLRPLTLDRPKPMLPVGDRPLLEWIITLLKQHGIADIAINLHYKPWSIIQRFGRGDAWGVCLRYSVEEQLLGSAGAARRLDWYWGGEPFVVFYGDLYTNLDIGQLIATHRRENAWITMALYEVDNPTACGIVALNERGHVVRFVEKPRPEQVFSHLANAGVFVVQSQVLDLVPPKTPCDFGHDLFPKMLAMSLPILGVPIQEWLIDIGTPENYQRAQEMAEHQAKV